jgi:hypothetical protein
MPISPGQPADANEVNAALNARLLLAGGIMQGGFTLYQDPVQPLDAVPLRYLQSYVMSVTISDTAPASPTAGKLWWDSVSGQLFIYYTDPNTSQWVAASNSSGIADAPVDSHTYGRYQNGWWQVLPISGGTLNGPGSLGLGGTAIPADALPGTLMTAGAGAVAPSGLNARLVSGAYISNTTGLFRYLGTSAASATQSQPDGSFAWLNAPAGAAGAQVTWTSVMSLSATGTLSTTNVTASSTLTGGYVHSTGNMQADGTLTVNNTLSVNSAGYLYLTSPQANHACVDFTCTNVRSWLTGCFNNGNWTVWDNSAGAERMHIDSSGNALVAQGMYANYLASYGNLQVNGSMHSNAACSTGDVFYCTGSNCGISPNNWAYRLNRDSSNGNWTFVENGTTNFYIDTAGNIWPRAAVTCTYMHTTGTAQVDGQCVCNGGCQSNNGNGVYFSATGHWFMASIDGNHATYLYIDGGNYCYIVANTSDARIKNVIGPHQRGLDEIKRLKVMDFTWKGNDDNPKRDPQLDPAPPRQPRDTTTVHAGIVAQDAEEFWPELIYRHPGYVDGEEVDDMRHIRTERLDYAMVNAVQELSAMVEQLAAQNEALVARVAALEAR